MNLNAMNPYSAAAEKAIAAQRAADVRKKLLKSAVIGEAPPTPDEVRMVGEWMDWRHGLV
jgi:hypothetical protein